MDAPAHFPISCDVAIVGAGVSGCFIARELSRYRLEIVIIERDSDVCSGASKGNGGAVHSGANTEPNTLKARLCVEGNARFPSLAEELSFPLKTVGSLIIARNESEKPHLEQLLQWAQANRVPDCRIIDSAEIKRLEPNVKAVAALFAPTLRITCPHRFVFALADNAFENGVKFLLDTTVTDIEVRRGKVTAVITDRGRINAKVVINAAGVHADRIAEMAGVRDFDIIPRRGEYYVLDKRVQLVSRNIFPVPTKVTKGTCVFPSIDGNNLIGPNADIVDDRDDTSTSASVKEAIIRTVKQFVPSLPEGEIIAAFAGVRATSDSGDFIIGHTRVDGFINVAGIQSPGLTASPAIAEMVVNLVGEKLRLTRNPKFRPERKRPKRFADCSVEERKALIARDARHSRIVCRCEMVTEKEIIDAIHLGLGARTINGIKFRTRAGMGRCQGGFCRFRVAQILARELNKPLTEVTLRGRKSFLFAGRVPQLSTT